MKEQDAAVLLRPQSSPCFVAQWAESIAGRMKIQHANLEWHDVNIVLWRWDFEIEGEHWTFLKHANGLYDRWQTHWYYMNHIQGPGHGAIVGDTQWMMVSERVSPAHAAVRVTTVEGDVSPFEPWKYWLLPQGIVLLETDKKWRRKLAYLVVQSYLRNFPDRLYRPVTAASGGKPGTVALVPDQRDCPEVTRVAYSSNERPNQEASSRSNEWWPTWHQQEHGTHSDHSNFATHTPEEASRNLQGLPPPAVWNAPASATQESWTRHSRWEAQAAVPTQPARPPQTGAQPVPPLPATANDATRAGVWKCLAIELSTEHNEPAPCHSNRG